ncbi:hypothetical protein D3C75_1194480 [compost metagenome]
MQVVIDIKRRIAHRGVDAEIVKQRVQLVAFNLPFQRGALFTGTVHPLAVGGQASKAGIHQSARQG